MNFPLNLSKVKTLSPVCPKENCFFFPVPGQVGGLYLKAGPIIGPDGTHEYGLLVKP